MAAAFFGRLAALEQRPRLRRSYSTVSIQKLCVGQLFCVGAALVAAHPRATTRGAPTAAPALSGYEWSQVGVFLLPPLMHRFTVDTVLLNAGTVEQVYESCGVRFSASFAPFLD